MNKIMLIGLMMTRLISNEFSAEPLVEKIKFASIQKSNELLTQEDNFTKNWSLFDIDSRMRKKGSSREELFEFITKQTRAWTTQEQNKILSIFKSIDEEIKKQGFHIDFPKEIYFIKTTTDEEGGADGYTRANYIVLQDNILSKGADELKKTIIHELFHILTRNSPKFRKEVYQIIGFNLMDNTVAYPENKKVYRITNPDAPQTDSYISIKVDGQPKDCMMILYSNKDYSRGSFFKYLNVGFLSLMGDSVKTIEYQDGQPIIYSFGEVTNFFEQVGKNTQYIIHPEEILAENFVYALTNKSKLSTPKIVEDIKMKLQQ